MSDRFQNKRFILSLALCVAVLPFIGCPDAAPPAAQATAPAVKAAVPTVQISANPAVINAGDQITLVWQTSGAFSVSIEGLGPVAASGSKTVSPPGTTTYHLIAKGDGGAAEASTTVTISKVLIANKAHGAKQQTSTQSQTAGTAEVAAVAVATPTGKAGKPTKGSKAQVSAVATASQTGSGQAQVGVAATASGQTRIAETAPVVDRPPSTMAPPDASYPSGTLTPEEEFKANVLDVYFDYDSYEVREEDKDTLSKNSAYLNAHPNVNITVGGFCDERGSNEYNISLGQNRAHSTKNALVNLGIAASRIRVVSYGKEKSYCSESNEECWQKNRRVGFSIDQ